MPAHSSRFPAVRLAVLLTLALFSSGCSKSVVLRSADGDLTLDYRCSRIRPQAESIEQIQLLASYARRVARDAAANQRYTTAMSIRNAFQDRDVRRMEAEIVDYICEYGYPDGSG
ncbi:MAG TPA: hypothetical protein VF771_13500 [Longimicrobiaceae bacterium]